jgi:hypothetical protein
LTASNTPEEHIPEQVFQNLLLESHLSYVADDGRRVLIFEPENRFTLGFESV